MRWYQFLPIPQCPAGPVPVIISELATGVTEGKLETQSETIRPRSSSSAKVGASPLSTALASISGCIASTTTRTSFRCDMALAEDPQALVFALGLAPAGGP